MFFFAYGTFIALGNFSSAKSSVFRSLVSRYSTLVPALKYVNQTAFVKFVYESLWNAKY